MERFWRGDFRVSGHHWRVGIEENGSSEIGICELPL